MLKYRLLFGSLLIAFLGGLAWAEVRASVPGTFLIPVAMVIAGLATAELSRMLIARKLRPLSWLAYFGNFAIVIATGLPSLGVLPSLGPLGPPLLAFALSVVLIFVVEVLRYHGPGQVIERIAMQIMALGYVGVLFSFVVQLRLLGPAVGIVALVSLPLVVKLSDIGAYTVGRLCGKHKLIPMVSPGKTWEGFAGGVVAACLGAWLACEVLLPWLVPETVADVSTVSRPGWHWLVYGLLVGITGVLGDLAESLLKREAGVKDSSDWVPGFGGVLDVFDSILLAAPVAYLGWIWH